MLVALAALGVGALLLGTRLTSISALEEAAALYQRPATTDAITGMLTRGGLESLLPRLLGSLQRDGASQCVVFVRIPDLHRAVRNYGPKYGEVVLITVADAVRDGVRAGDLVARWSDDSFVATGPGLLPDARMLGRRIQARVSATGADMGKWPIVVETGAAAGPPEEADFIALVDEARASAAHVEASSPTEG
jgi:diguanylate cyclase (GGDEF)-like protein